MNYLKNLFYISILLLTVSNISIAQEKDSLVPAVYYFENGKISSEGTLRNGKPDGYWKSYYPSSVLKTEGNRKNYLLDGQWKFYTEEGLLYLTIDYKEDKGTLVFEAQETVKTISITILERTEQEIRDESLINKK